MVHKYYKTNSLGFVNRQIAQVQVGKRLGLARKGLPEMPLLGLEEGCSLRKESESRMGSIPEGTGT